MLSEKKLWDIFCLQGKKQKPKAQLVTSESYSQSFGQPQRLERSGPLLVGPAPVYSIAREPEPMRISRGSGEAVDNFCRDRDTYYDFQLFGSNRAAIGSEPIFSNQNRQNFSTNTVFVYNHSQNMATDNIAIRTGNSLNRENKEKPLQPVSINGVFENIWSSQNLVDNVNIVKT